MNSTGTSSTFTKRFLNANTIQANAAGLSRPELRFNQYGGNAGGAIKRNKLFFWVGFEGLNRRTGVTDTYTVLSPLGRSSVVDPQIQSFVTSYVPLPNQPATASIPTLRFWCETTSVRFAKTLARRVWIITGPTAIICSSAITTTIPTPPRRFSAESHLPGAPATCDCKLDPHLQPLYDCKSQSRLQPPRNRQLGTSPNPGLSLSSIFSIDGSYLWDYPQSETIAADLTKIKGSHNFQMGFELRHTVDSRIQDNGSTFTFLRRRQPDE